MASLGHSAGWEEAASAGAATLDSGGCFILALCSRDRTREVLRIERLEIIETFADADGVDGKLEALGDGHKDAAARRAVELGHHDPGDARDLLEDLDLIERVLPGGGVEHEDDAVRRSRVELLQHPNDLGELGHELGFVLEAPGGVDEEHVRGFRAGALERFIGDPCRVGPHLLGDDLDAHTPTPHFELIDGRGAEGIGGGEHDAQTLALELMRHLGRGGGLAGAVHADHEEDMGTCAREREGFRHRLKHACDLCGQNLAHRSLIEPPVVTAFGNCRADAPGHGDPKIGLDQDLFDPIERVLIELPLGERAGEIVGQGIGGAGETYAQLIEPAPLRLSRSFGLFLLAVAHGLTAMSAAPSSPATTASTRAPAPSSASRRTGVKSAERPWTSFSMSTVMRRPLAPSRCDLSAATPFARSSPARLAITAP